MLFLQSIPIILFGRHVLINVAPGTGKTVAYLAPIIHLFAEPWLLQSLLGRITCLHPCWVEVLSALGWISSAAINLC